MDKIKVMTVFGTRPEAIKMAPLIQELRSRQEFESVVCVTAQHRRLLDQVLGAFEIEPDFDLDIMQPGQTLTQITARILSGMDEVIERTTPNIILVHGDTTTSFAAALAAFYHKIPIGHVEAGLRTRQKYSPFPEEMNRQFVGVMADMHFSPTEQSRKNLLAEGKRDEDIYVTGNTAIDALKTTVRNDYKNDLLDWAEGGRLVILTAHRRENLGDPMRRIFSAINRIIKKHTDVKVVYPVHPNPPVVRAAAEAFSGNPRVRLVEPMDVVDFHNVLARSHIVLTDSGGIQEEAPSLGKPVIVLRDTTERPEGIAAGTLKLAGTQEATVFGIIDELLTDQAEYEKMSRAKNPYGDGMASVRIANAIAERFPRAKRPHAAES